MNSTLQSTQFGKNQAARLSDIAKILSELGRALDTCGGRVWHLDCKDTAEGTIGVIVGDLDETEACDTVDSARAGGA